MFTGIIQHMGTVISLKSERLVIQSDFKDIEVGESIAVNGVCLTQLPFAGSGQLSFDLSAETLALTHLASLKPQDKVNLERAMHMNSRFGGHYVSGHVDGTLTLLASTPHETCIEWLVGPLPKESRRYCVKKGSITIEGVSLTINDLREEGVSLMLIPHTLAETTLGVKQVGDGLNVEFDYVAKLIAHQLSMNTLENIER